MAEKEMKKMVSVNCDLHKGLKVVAAALDMTQDQIIREALKTYLSQLTNGGVEKRLEEKYKTLLRIL